jgi:hypothetical protein
MTLNLTSLQSALVSTVLMAILAVAAYIIALGNIFAIDWKVMLNLGALSLLTGLVSLIKNYLTTPQGTVAGVQVK